VIASDAGPPVESIQELERRQDVVLRELELLEERLATLLGEYAAWATAAKKTAA